VLRASSKKKFRDSVAPPPVEAAEAMPEGEEGGSGGSDMGELEALLASGEEPAEGEKCEECGGQYADGECAKCAKAR